MTLALANVVDRDASTGHVLQGDVSRLARPQNVEVHATVIRHVDPLRELLRAKEAVDLARLRVSAVRLLLDL